MDAAADERGGAAGDGLVNTRLRIALLMLAAASLLAGIAGGLLRLGVPMPQPGAPGAAALQHALLMIGGFFGTVIALERAVAVAHPAGFVAPLSAGVAGLALLMGAPEAGAVLLLMSSVVLALLTLRVLVLQPAGFNRLLLAASACWIVAAALFATGQGTVTVLPWAFDFLVLTVAAERLEMTRLMRRSRAAMPLLMVAVGWLLVASLACSVWPQAGQVGWGLGLVMVAGWLACLDIARRTVRTQGVARFAAVSLLAGYGWLAVAGAVWALAAAGVAALRDVALHALALGFVVSMVMGHAPLIVPAIVRMRMSFGRRFYLPLALLHGSLLVRFAPALAAAADMPFDDPGLRALGGSLNAVAMATFAVLVITSLRRRRPGRARDALSLAPAGPTAS